MKRLAVFFQNLPVTLRATVLYALGLIWSRGLGLLMVPVMTAHLAPSRFAQLELLTSAAEIGGLMVGAGLVDTLFRFADPATAKGQRAASEVAGLAWIVAAGLVAIVAVLAVPLARLMPLTTTPTQIRLIGLLIAADLVAGVSMGWLRMAGRAGRHAVVASLRATLQAAAAALLLMAGFGVTGVIAAGAGAAALAVSLLATGKPASTGVALHPRGWPRLLTYGAPLLGTGLASFILGTADRWLLAGGPAEALGQYALALRFALIVTMLMQPFDLWWYARRIPLLDQPDGLARTARVIRLGVAGIATAASLTAAVGPWAIAALAPPAYAPAATMLPWLVLALSIQMLSSLVNVGCYMGRSTGWPLLINALAAGLALLLYLLLIPRLGVAGAIAATLAGQVLRLALFTIVAQRRVRIALPYVTTLALACVAIASAAAVQLSPGLSGALIAASSVALCAAATAIFAGNAWRPDQAVRLRS